MKERIERKCVDPMRILSPELYDLIFQHLKPKDLMRKSFVSKLWHEEIGNSQNMKRINIFIYKNTQDDLDESFETLLTSQRNYKNVSVNLGTLVFDESLERVAKVGQTSYKKVKYSDGKMCKSLWPMECIEKTVQTLILSFIRCDFECDKGIVFKFPQLRHLTLYKNAQNINLLFKKCTNLLTFDYSERKELNEWQLVREILLNNSTMKTLSLQIMNGSAQIKNIINLCKFRLRKLSFHSPKLNVPMTVDNRELLCDILQLQSKSLEELSINQWCGYNGLEIIFQMKKLINLTFDINYGTESLPTISLNVNTSITRVDIDDMKDNDSFILYKIFKSLPNLIIYKTCLMQNHDMIMLERHCKKLKELYVENFSVNFVPTINFFPNIMLFKSLDINNEIVMSILAKEDCKRSHFERLVLAAATWICCFMA
ncbi:hypothetical protein ACKWTF_013569 [Chironomus riparius]